MVQKSPSSKAAALLTRGAYSQYVSTAKWRERRWRLFSTFPGMIPAKGETTSGRLYDGVDSRTLHILDEFEDEVYSRELLTVYTQEGERVGAFSYIIPLEHRGILTSQPWCRDYFIAHYLPEYVTSCQAFYQDMVSRL